MMLNTLSSTTWDTAGFVELNVKDSVTAGDTRRRIARVATLDGGVTVNDGGFTDSDRVLELTWTPSSASSESAVARLVRLYQQANISTRDGVFVCALESYTPGADESRLRALVLSKASQ
jgi:hypothetical protein